MRFWLIQRGRWNPYIKDESQIKDLIGRNGLVTLEYMRGAEFDFNAIPKAYRRIMAEFNEYKLIITTITRRINIPLYIFCHKDRAKETEEALTAFLRNPYPTKGYTGFESWYNPPCEFWWEIEKGIDFMYFVGPTEKVEMFLKVLDNDYNNWWMAKTEETRIKELEIFDRKE